MSQTAGFAKSWKYSYEDLLFLVPWYGIHFSVSQKMWAVSNLNINHSFPRFVLNKLIGYPLYGLSVSTEKEKGKWKWMTLPFGADKRI